MESIISTSEPGHVDLRPELGRAGERLAVAHLEENGYRIVLTNFRVPVGRNSKGVQITGEIDVIALDNETLCFVEVKTRTSEDFAPAITAVDLRKQRQIARTARVYRRMFGLMDATVRFDAVTVLMPKHAAAEVKLTKGYWTESVLRRKVWRGDAWMDR